MRSPPGPAGEPITSDGDAPTVVSTYYLLLELKPPPKLEVNRCARGVPHQITVSPQACAAASAVGVRDIGFRPLRRPRRRRTAAAAADETSAAPAPQVPQAHLAQRRLHRGARGGRRANFVGQPREGAHRVLQGGTAASGGV